jgi:hypothetical protein
MGQIRRPMAVGSLCALLLPLGAGCMPGMTYRIPMPSSMTFGTVKADDATLASGEARPAKPFSGPRSALRNSNDVAMISR